MTAEILYANIERDKPRTFQKGCGAEIMPRFLFSLFSRKRSGPQPEKPPTKFYKPLDIWTKKDRQTVFNQKRNAKLLAWGTIFLLSTVTAGVFFVLLIGFKPSEMNYYTKPKKSSWQFQSIDTMKYSRDLSREKLNNSAFNAVINEQVKNIAQTGATHVALATPYDAEFLPMLKRWVAAARQYNLNIWFRGNWSGWEGWFGYSAISREQHLQKTKNFILTNSSLFEDGDIFSACPECENGGPGDPRQTGDVAGHRKFIIEEYQATKSAFATINKKVQSNYFSMNGDVARLVMDKQTTAALDGLVTIDHYVKTPSKLAQDIQDMATDSGGKIILGELGVPILDVNGKMNEEEQADWLRQALQKLSAMPEVTGINYWLNVGGSTELWNSDGVARQAVSVITSFYRPGVIYGAVKDELGQAINQATISYNGKVALSRQDGYFELSPIESLPAVIKISAEGFLSQSLNLNSAERQINITLVKIQKDIMFKIKYFLKKLVEPHNPN